MHPKFCRSIPWSFLQILHGPSANYASRIVLQSDPHTPKLGVSHTFRLRPWKRSYAVVSQYTTLRYRVRCDSDHEVLNCAGAVRRMHDVTYGRSLIKGIGSCIRATSESFHTEMSMPLFLSRNSVPSVCALVIDSFPILHRTSSSLL